MCFHAFVAPKTRWARAERHGDLHEAVNRGRIDVTHRSAHDAACRGQRDGETERNGACVAFGDSKVRFNVTFIRHPCEFAADSDVKAELRDDRLHRSAFRGAHQEGIESRAFLREQNA